MPVAVRWATIDVNVASLRAWMPEALGSRLALTAAPLLTRRSLMAAAEAARRKLMASPGATDAPTCRGDGAPDVGASPRWLAPPAAGANEALLAALPTDCEGNPAVSRLRPPVAVRRLMATCDPDRAGMGTSSRGSSASALWPPLTPGVKCADDAAAESASGRGEAAAITDSDERASAATRMPRPPTASAAAGLSSGPLGSSEGEFHAGQRTCASAPASMSFWSSASTAA